MRAAVKPRIDTTLKKQKSIWNFVPTGSSVVSESEPLGIFVNLDAQEWKSLWKTVCNTNTASDLWPYTWWSHIENNVVPGNFLLVIDTAGWRDMVRWLSSAQFLLCDIHNLYRMSDEVTINLRWMIGRSPFFALMPLVTMYYTTINSGRGTDTEDWIYISISIAKMQIVDLQIVYDCGCTICIVAERFGTRIAFTDLCQKMPFILHGMYICSCLVEQGTNKESINFQYNNQPNKYSHCQRLNRNKLIYKHDNIWALMYWSMPFYVAKQAYMHDLKA